jgi:hypothetical protein
MVKIHYKMPYRMLEGFARFFFEQFKKMNVPGFVAQFNPSGIAA